MAHRAVAPRKKGRAYVLFPGGANILANISSENHNTESLLIAKYPPEIELAGGKKERQGEIDNSVVSVDGACYLAAFVAVEAGGCFQD